MSLGTAKLKTEWNTILKIITGEMIRGMREAFSRTYEGNGIVIRKGSGIKGRFLKGEQKRL